MKLHLRQPLGTNLEMGSMESRLDLLIDTHLPELSIAFTQAQYIAILALISGNFNAPPVPVGQVGARKEGEDGNDEASSALPLRPFDSIRVWKRRAASLSLPTSFQSVTSLVLSTSTEQVTVSTV